MRKTHRSQSRRTVWRAILPVAFLLAAPAVAPAAANPGQLWLSFSANRAAPVALDGLATAGDVYIHYLPSTTAQGVEFHIDDPQGGGTPDRTENTAPYDLGGGSVNFADPFDTGGLADGAHTLTAIADLGGGEADTLTATFTVANAGPGLSWPSPAPALTGMPGDPADTLQLWLGTSDAQAVSYSSFSTAPWLAPAPAGGSAPDSVAVVVDPTGLPPGLHLAQLVAVSATHAPAVATISLDLRSPWDQLHLAFTGDPATSFTACWRTTDTSAPSSIQYREAGTTPWSTATGGVRPSGVLGLLHEATATGLAPATEHEYRVAVTDSGWSPVQLTRTAPLPGQGPLEIIFVADTGILGRTDGLTQGTQQVLDEMLAQRPHLLLLGGDYAYFSSEDRYPTLDEAIDAWFNMMQPVGAAIPMFPTWGNHDVLLNEDVETWIERFPLPNPHDGGRNAHLDIGDMRLIALQAVQESGAIPASRVDWLEGVVLGSPRTWTVPFMHSPPFSEGVVHPSNLPLRQQLGPLAEQWDVDLWLTAHDQNYERTFPLVDVPATNSPTRTILSGYDHSDGTTWVKVSPGGKLSNKSLDFSPWPSPTPPPWTAVRDNTLHHWARLVATGESLLVEVWGVDGNGSAPALVDSFRYFDSGGTPRLLPQPLQLQLVGRAGSNLVGDFVEVGTSDGLADSVTFVTSGPWLSAGPATIEVPGSTALVADFAQLAAGEHQGSALLASAEHGSTTVQVLALASSELYDLRVSGEPDREPSQSLHGSGQSGDLYIFTAPDSAVTGVDFYLDDPLRASSPFRSESNAPFDLAGGSATAANPFDVDSLGEGWHLVTALLSLQGGGSTVVHARVLVGGGGGGTGNPAGPPPGSSLLSMAPPRPNPARGLAAISLRLVEPAALDLQVFDLRGRRVATLLDGSWRPAGEHLLHWDGRDGAGHEVTSGVYFLRATAAGEQQVRRLTWLR